MNRMERRDLYWGNLILLVFLILAGCESPCDYQSYDTHRRHSKSSNIKIPILYETPETRHYVIIGHFTGTGSDVSDDAIFQSLENSAHLEGADAIVVIERRDQPFTKMVMDRVDPPSHNSDAESSKKNSPSTKKESQSKRDSDLYSNAGSNSTVQTYHEEKRCSHFISAQFIVYLNEKIKPRKSLESSAISRSPYMSLLEEKFSSGDPHTR